MAVRFTDTEKNLVSEASAYRILKAHDLITSPALIVVRAANEFKDKTSATNELWQTDFSYLKVIGGGWFCLSAVLGDDSRNVIAWKLCTTLKGGDVYHGRHEKILKMRKAIRKQAIQTSRPHTSLDGLTPAEFAGRSNMDQNLNRRTYE